MSTMGIVVLVVALVAAVLLVVGVIPATFIMEALCQIE